MKKIITLSLFIVFLAVLTDCSNNKIQVNGMKSSVRKIVSGKEIELQTGTKVVLLGVKDSEHSKKYLEQHVKGKRVTIISDSKQPQFINTYLTKIYAYVRVEGEKGCVQNKLLQGRYTKVSNITQCDSLKSFAASVKAKQHSMMNSDELLTYMKPATFCIMTNSGSGTGFFINDNGLALTNNHVLDESKESGATIYFFGDDGKLDTTNKYKVNRIIKTNRDEKVDYTIFTVQLGNQKCQYLPLIEQKEKDGSQLAKLGCPVGEIGNFQTGVLSNYGKNFIVHSIASNHGDSGGPVVNFKGEVVGINQSIQFNPILGEQAKGIAYAVDALYIKKVLEELNIEYGR